MSTTVQGSSAATTESTAMSSTNTTSTTTTTSVSPSTTSTSTTSTSTTSTSDTSVTSNTSPPQTSTTRSSSPTDTGSSSDSDSSSFSSSSNSNSNSNPDTSGQTSISSDPTNNSTTLTAPATTIFQTTVVFTTGDSRVTSVVQTTSTLSAGSIVPGTAIKGNDNARVRAIVGGVVGGLLGLVLIALVAFFYIRRQRQKRIEKTFDGNFDPAATDKRSSTMNSIRGPASHNGGGTLPNVGGVEDVFGDDGMGGRLAGTSIGGGIVSPFMLPPSSPVSRTSVDDPRRISEDRLSRPISPQTTGSSSFNPHANYAYSPPSPMAASHVQQRSISPNSARYPPSSFSYPNKTPSVPPSVSSGSEYTPSHSSAAAAKEREAQGFNVMNPDTDPNPFASGVTRQQRENYLRSGPSRSQYQGGDIPDEIPPAYDTLLDR